MGREFDSRSVRPDFIGSERHSDGTTESFTGEPVYALWQPVTRPTCSAFSCVEPVKRLLAVPTGFEPAIFSLTGRYARPLHHGTVRTDSSFQLHREPEVQQASPLPVGRAGFEPA